MNEISAVSKLGTELDTIDSQPNDKSLSLGQRIGHIFDRMIGAMVDKLLYQAFQNGSLRKFAARIVNWNIDPQRAERSIDLMSSLGALRQKIDTPDGAALDSLFLTQESFRLAIEEQGGKIERYQANKTDSGEYVISNESARKIKVIEIDDIENSELADNIRNLIGSWSDDHAWKETTIIKDGISKRVFLIGDLDQNENPGKGVMWRLSGMGPNMSFHKKFLMRAISLEQDVFLMDYRNFHKSKEPAKPKGGHFTEAVNDMDAETGLKFITEKGYAPKEITLHGSCVGGHPASYLAEKHPGMNLIIDSSFVKADKLFTTMLPRILRGLGHAANRGQRARAEKFARTYGIDQNGFNIEARLRECVVQRALMLKSSSDETVPENDFSKLIQALDVRNEGKVTAIIHESHNSEKDGHNEDTVANDTWDSYKNFILSGE